MTRSRDLRVLHVMRTYGMHGGENQLAAYFAAGPDPGLKEAFAFIYRDEACRTLFLSRGANIPTHDLWSKELVPGSAWQEVLRLLPLLPIFQWRLARLLRKVEANVCVVHGVQAALVAWPIALLLGRRVRFLYVHRITKALGKGAWAKLLYGPFRLLAGNSKAVARSLEGLASPERIIALENGVDIKRLDARSTGGKQLPENPGPIVIAVGRLLPHKRQALILEAIAVLISAHTSVTLWIVGDGPERGPLQELTHQLGLGNTVVFLGHRQDVPALLARATVFVNASAWEGMSNAVLEAMAVGLPSVVAEAPGVSECHINGETGLVVSGDALAIAAAIGRLLGDAYLQSKLGGRAREHARSHYSIEAARQRYLDVYRRLAREAA